MSKDESPVVNWVATSPDQAWASRAAGGASQRSANLAFSGTRHQAWEGCGGCFNELGWIALQALPEAARRRILSALFDPRTGCGFNVCRLPIGASDYAAEWYSLNETDGDHAMKHFSVARDRRYLIPYIRAALRHRPDMALFASPWSPPTWMKRPKAYNCGTLVWTRRNLQAYALYFVRFVQAYAAQGLAIRQVHVQNEPVADQKFPSCLWTGGQLRDFIRDHLGPAFRRHGLKTEIWLGTLNTDDYHGFPHTVLNDARARQFISGVGLQWAGKGAIQRLSMSWPEVRLMQTENECGNGRNTWEHAHHVFGLMQHYIVNGARAYVYWNMVLEDGGVSTWGWPQNSMITVNPARRTFAMQPEFYVMKHLSRFVAPGAVRLGLEGSLTGHGMAFENPDGRRVLLVHNPLETALPLALDTGGACIGGRLEPRSFSTFVLNAGPRQ